MAQRFPTAKRLKAIAMDGTAAGDGVLLDVDTPEALGALKDTG